MAFDTAGNLRAHKSRVHTEKRFSCTECFEHFQEQSSIAENIENVSDQSFTFPTYALLQAHIRTVHPPKCPNCPITCSTSRELRRHLEVAHGDVSLEDRKIFKCTVDGCDRSFTKKGNLTVHIRTFHEGEKRFACGETDLSASKKVTGWDGHGCGKRYGTKLALEEHVRTSHLGFKNCKAERRERLGLTNKPSNHNQVTTLAALTGQGYAEETGRHISCFYDSCEHRFHRDYDLWVHMTAKHSCSEDQVQALFMQRALLSDQTGLGGNALGIYGLEFDQSFAGATNLPYSTDTQTAPDSRLLVQSDYSFKTDEDMDSMIPSHNEMALMDQAHDYHLMEE